MRKWPDATLTAEVEWKAPWGGLVCASQAPRQTPPDSRGSAGLVFQRKITKYLQPCSHVSLHCLL